MGTTKNWRTLFFVSGSVRLVFWEGVLGVSFKLFGVNVPSVPNEVLEELVAVLFLHDDASGLDDVLGVLNEFTTFGTELVLVDRGMVENVFQRVVDLSVVGQPLIAEGLNNAVKSQLGTELRLKHRPRIRWCWTYLAIDVSSLGVLVRWLHDGARSGFLCCLLGSSG